jgi:hypothetical protein
MRLTDAGVLGPSSGDLLRSRAAFDARVARGELPPPPELLHKRWRGAEHEAVRRS